MMKITKAEILNSGDTMEVTWEDKLTHECQTSRLRANVWLGAYCSTQADRRLTRMVKLLHRHSDVLEAENETLRDIIKKYRKEQDEKRHEQNEPQA